MNLNHSLKRFFMWTGAFCLIPAAVFAHNPQIQIGIDNNRIVTNALFPDGPYQNATANQRVYEIPLAQRTLGDANDGWYAEPNHVIYPFAGPGVALLDGIFSAGSVLKVSFLDGLKIWNGSIFTDPGAEQFAVSMAASFVPSALTAHDAPFGSVSLAVGPVADEHKTLRWRLLGDGVSPNTASDDGIYLLTLQLSTSQAGIAPSLPYYFLLNKNASSMDAAAALAHINTNLVPEPATIGMIVLGASMLARRRAQVSVSPSK